MIRFLLPALLGSLLASCSIRNTAVNASASVIDEVQTSFFLESDVALARESFPTFLKLAEAMHRFYPKSPYYSGKLCFLFTAYAFAFVDDSPWADTDEKGEAGMKRLLSFYDRAFEYGMASMEASIPGWRRDLLSPSNSARVLAKVRPKHVETLFWLDFAWMMRILNNTADPALLTQLAIAEKLALRIAEVQPDYLYGSVYAVLGAFWGGRSKAVGGDPEKARAFNLKAESYAAGKSLIPAFVELRYHITQTTDQKAFDATLEEIRGFKADCFPAFRFINEVIQHKTETLAKKKAMLFGG
ncbi:MAG: hypothetical protein J0L75_05380 [Spirochaetes bacterium]|nr:hypothetical protein [Spirochaetota bacterium]